MEKRLARKHESGAAAAGGQETVVALTPDTEQTETPEANAGVR